MGQTPSRRTCAAAPLARPALRSWAPIIARWRHQIDLIPPLGRVPVSNQPKLSLCPSPPRRIHDDEHITLIDFPQMVSISHANAQMYFERDGEAAATFRAAPARRALSAVFVPRTDCSRAQSSVVCVSTFFEKRFHFVSMEPKPSWDEIMAKRRWRPLPATPPSPAPDPCCPCSSAPSLLKVPVRIIAHTIQVMVN